MSSSLLLVFFASAASVAGFGYMDGGVPFSVEGFVPYFNYEGELMVSGTITGMTVGTTHTMEYSLSGVDPLCMEGAGDAANSCGIHFHEGMDCVSDAGGHYYDTVALTEDPWATVSYVSDSDNETSGADVSVETGLDYSEIIGHAFVVHGFGGERIACAIIA